MRMLVALVTFALASGASADDLAAPAGPAAAPAPAPASAIAPATPGYGKPSGLLPGMVIGPKLHLIGVPPGFGLEARIANTFSLSVDYTLIPTTALSDVKASYGDFSGAARWYPWHASFYLGAAFGTRTFKAKVTDSTSGETASAEVASTYLAPEIGWRWIWSSGFFLGMDLGYQIILSDKTTLVIPLAVDPSSKKDVTDAADHIGKIGLPILSLLQIGWYL